MSNTKELQAEKKKQAKKGRRVKSIIVGETNLINELQPTS